ncbi:MAG TPA: metal-dependent hydrolase [Acinetobacter parvus]|jgi:predicted metal-dependent HD superfamily phosphohydrolase|uniref:HD domain-containing protein n=1 Tax=Acinetobacter parvus TaxID=134533 RepID=UPI002C9F5C76|nr:metal-dependent hydrolase [Acinetobacter parvus]HRM14665.1 metal-dependent hydrolase [Acinetobacter parvus]
MQQYIPALEKSWFELHQHYHFSEPQKLLNKLISAYSEKQRAYHTVQHLYECLTLLESVKPYLNDFYAVALALWFHDAVYNPQAQDNELKSTELFEQYLSADLSDQTLIKIKQWIVATQKHASTDELDLQFLLDIDLAILASSPARFTEYEQQIQKEYVWVEPELYAVKRKEVLQHFYQTQPLYQTEYFQQNFELQAKQNLNRVQ